MVCDVNQTRQWHDLSYRCNICQKNKELSWSIRLGVVWFMMKTKTRQWRGRSYRSSQHQNWNWTIETYLTRCDLWWKLNKQQCDWWYRCDLWRKWNSIVIIIQTEYGLWQKSNRTTMRPIYRSSLHWNKNWTIWTYLIRCDLWWKPDRITT